MSVLEGPRREMRRILYEGSNGRLVQEGQLAEEMFFGIDYLVADLARLITLEPGDIVLTGTPANSRPMQPGDLIEVQGNRICAYEGFTTETRRSRRKKKKRCLAREARHSSLLRDLRVSVVNPSNRGAGRHLRLPCIEVEITGIGRLANRVVEAPAPRARIGHQPTDSDNVRKTALGNDERLPPQLRQR